MKKSEKEALKKAFNIPEPQRKNSFIAKYSDIIRKNESRSRLPIIIKYASTAAFAALIIGLWGQLSKTADFRDNFNGSDIVTDIITEIAVQQQTTCAEDIAETVTSALKSVISENTQTKSSQSIIHSTETKKSQYTTAVSEYSEHNDTTRTSALSENDNSSQNNKTTTQNHLSESHQTTAVSQQPHQTTTVKQTTVYVETPKPTTLAPTSTDAEVNCPPIAPSTTMPSENDPAQDEGTEWRNYTVTPWNTYEKTDNVINIYWLKDTNGTVDSKPNDEINSSYPQYQIDFLKSDYIVLATINEIIYTDAYNMPFTQENLEIQLCCKGNGLNVSDMISVYLPGGYISVEKYEELYGSEYSLPENSCIYDPGGNKGEQKVGETYIFFIKNGSSDIPTGAYELTSSTDISIYKNNGNEYVSLGDKNLKFTLDELFNF